jgi:hypothetical protein
MNMETRIESFLSAAQLDEKNRRRFAALKRMPVEERIRISHVVEHLFQQQALNELDYIDCFELVAALGEWLKERELKP